MDALRLNLRAKYFYIMYIYFKSQINGKIKNHLHINMVNIATEGEQVTIRTYLAIFITYNT